MTPDEIHESLRPSDCKSFAQPRAAGTLPVVDERQMNGRLNRGERMRKTGGVTCACIRSRKDACEWSLRKSVNGQACYLGNVRALGWFPTTKLDYLLTD